MTCSAMTIYMEKAPTAGQPAGAAAGDPAKTGDAAAAGASSSHVKHLDAAGPVTVVSKTQVATGDSASYDKAQNKVWLIGNVTLSDSGNVTKGDKLTYDLTTGEATVDTGSAANRVKGLFIPGSGEPTDDDKTEAREVEISLASLPLARTPDKRSPPPGSPCLERRFVDRDARPRAGESGR